MWVACHRESELEQGEEVSTHVGGMVWVLDLEQCEWGIYDMTSLREVCWLSEPEQGKQGCALGGGVWGGV